MSGERARAALIEHHFPEIVDWGYEVTSDITVEYNCIAWAAGDDTRVWWPGLEGSSYWPSGVAHAETLDAFRGAFETLGYVLCETEDLEEGFEKIAFYADPSGSPTHATRQIDGELWTSKVGSYQDIRHPLRALEGAEYGKVALFMKRPVGVRIGG